MRTVVSTRCLRLKFRPRPCCDWRACADSVRLTAMIPPARRSKEAHDGNPRPPPRPTSALPEVATSVRLDQLWNQLPQSKRQELLGQLTRIVARRLAAPDGKGAADE